MTIFATTHSSTTPDTDDRGPAARLLTAGLLAGPMFGIVAAAQIATREGFDLSVHPISLLATGGAGWIQVVNFVLAGVLVLATAHGLRRTLARGGAAATACWSIGVFGVGLIASGVFPTDPGFAFPSGTPAGPAASMSWHNVVHSGAAALAYTALVVGVVAVSVRLARTGHRLAAGVNVLPAVAILALGSAPTEPGASIRIALSAVVAFAWIAVVAAAARRSVR